MADQPLVVEADLTGSMDGIPFKVSSAGARIEMQFERPLGRQSLLQIQGMLAQQNGAAFQMAETFFAKSQLQVVVTSPDGTIAEIGSGVAGNWLGKLAKMPTARVHLKSALRAILRQ